MTINAPGSYRVAYWCLFLVAVVNCRLRLVDNVKLLHVKKIMTNTVDSPVVISCNLRDILPKKNLRTFNDSNIQEILFSSLLDVEKLHKLLAVYDHATSKINVMSKSNWQYHPKEPFGMDAANQAIKCSDTGFYYCSVKLKGTSIQIHQTVQLVIHVHNHVHGLEHIILQGEKTPSIFLKNTTVICSALTPYDGRIKWFTRCFNAKFDLTMKDYTATVSHKPVSRTALEYLENRKCQFIERTSTYVKAKHSYPENCSITCCAYTLIKLPHSSLSSVDMDCASLSIEDDKTFGTIENVYAGAYGSITIMLVGSLAFLSFVIFILCCIFFSMTDDDDIIDAKRKKVRRWLAGQYISKQRKKQEQRKLRKLRQRHSTDIISQGGSSTSQTPKARHSRTHIGHRLPLDHSARLSEDAIGKSNLLNRQK